MPGSNPGLLRLWHWQPDALTTRLELIHGQTRNCIFIPKIKYVSHDTAPLERKLRVASRFVSYEQKLLSAVLLMWCHTLSFLLQQFQYLHTFFGITRLALLLRIKGTFRLDLIRLRVVPLHRSWLGLLLLVGFPIFNLDLEFLHLKLLAA